MFEAIDEDGSGTISVDELREGLRKKGTKLDQVLLIGAHCSCTTVLLLCQTMHCCTA